MRRKMSPNCRHVTCQIIATTAMLFAPGCLEANPVSGVEVIHDSESDEIVDDNCPNDPNKVEPGDCGCGTPDGSTFIGHYERSPVVDGRHKLLAKVTLDVSAVSLEPWTQRRLRRQSADGRWSWHGDPNKS